MSLPRPDATSRASEVSTTELYTVSVQVRGPAALRAKLRKLPGSPQMRNSAKWRELPASPLVGLAIVSTRGNVEPSSTVGQSQPAGREEVAG